VEAVIKKGVYIIAPSELVLLKIQKENSAKTIC
jgi:hypothetical protein